MNTTDMLIELEKAIANNDDSRANAIASALGLERRNSKPVRRCIHDNTCAPMERLLVEFGLYW